MSSGRAYSASQIRQVREKSRDECHYCHCDLSESFRFDGRMLNHTQGGISTIDHILPLSKGGHRKVSNMVLSCVSCNNAKGSMSSEDFIATLNPPTMTPELEQLQKEAREKMRSLIFSSSWKNNDEIVDILIAKAFLAGEESGKNKAVDFLKENGVIEGLGAGKFVHHISGETLEEARTS